MDLIRKKGPSMRQGNIQRLEMASWLMHGICGCNRKRKLDTRSLEISKSPRSMKSVKEIKGSKCLNLTTPVKIKMNVSERPTMRIRNERKGRNLEWKRKEKKRREGRSRSQTKSTRD